MSKGSMLEYTLDGVLLPNVHVSLTAIRYMSNFQATCLRTFDYLVQTCHGLDWSVNGGLLETSLGSYSITIVESDSAALAVRDDLDDEYFVLHCAYIGQDAVHEMLVTSVVQDFCLMYGRCG